MQTRARATSWGIGALLVYSSGVGFALSTGRDVAQKVLPSVVLIVMEDVSGQPLALGSGFLIANDLIATNHHVIQGAAGGYAKGVGQEKKVRLSGIVGTDPVADLALLKLAEPKSPAVVLGDDTALEPGDEIFAIGNPLGLEGSISQGIVSGVRQFAGHKLFQITAPISPGSSGGPVVGATGKVVGIAVGTFTDGQNVNFAIHVSALTALLRSTRQSPVTSFDPSRSGTARPLAGIGPSGLDEILVSDFRWTEEYGYTVAYAISITNKLRVTISDVKVRAMFLTAIESRSTSKISHAPGTVLAASHLASQNDA